MALSPQAGREQLALPPYLCSMQALHGLEDAHACWGEPSALLSLPIQVLLSLGNTLSTQA